MQEKLEQWAKEQWQDSNLGDTRRTKRAVKLAVSFLNKPDATMPCQFAEWKDLKAAYRFLNTKEISHELIQKKHRDQVLEKAKKEATVLFIQDTSELDYTSHRANMDLGPIGNYKKRGIFIHSALTVAFQNSIPKIIGLAHQKVWIRENKRYRRNETRSQRRKRSKESSLWKETLEAITKPKNSHWVSVGDRGNDIFDFFLFCQKNEWNYLIRAGQDRTVIVNDQEKLHLKEWSRKLPMLAEKTIKLRSRDGMPSREINLKVTWQKVALLHPKNYGKEYENIQANVWCIRCWEEAPNGVEWILLTNLPVLNKGSVFEKIDWYASRWLIEEYHKCLKTGCGIEKRQLRKNDGLKSILGFMGIIATKLLELKFLARHNPNDIAKNHISFLNLEILCSHFQLNPGTITLHQYWHKIAKLGGFIGRKSDGDPGWQTLWKGQLRLFDMISGAESITNCG